MLIRELINKLEELDASYDAGYREIMGDPEIMIDVFKLQEIQHSSAGMINYFTYQGFSKDIKIEKSSDGVYDILSGFTED